MTAQSFCRTRRAGVSDDFPPLSAKQNRNIMRQQSEERRCALPLNLSGSSARLSRKNLTCASVYAIMVRRAKNISQGRGIIFIMNENRLDKLYRISRILVTALVALCGVSYVISSIHLFYTGGDTPYALERVSGYLLYLLPVSVLTVLSVIASGVLSVMRCEGEAKLRGAADKRDILGKLYRRYRISAVDKKAIGEGNMAIVTDPESYGKIASEHKRRRVACSVFSALVGVTAAASLIFLLNPASYDPTPTEYNSTVISLALWALLPAVTLVGGYFVLSGIQSESYGAELLMVKAQIASSTPAEAPITKPDGSKNTQKLYTGIRIVTLTVALALVITGIATGEVVDIIDKAIRICQECIGIG